ncbi:MAG: glycoside hydrolase family 2 TIM barrel-domain containing protein, partial [Candidatus Poribacteria bacterium]
AVRGSTFRATLIDNGSEIAVSQVPAMSGTSLALKIDHPHLWSCADPYLYDLRLELLKGEEVIDCVSSYAGLRKFHIEGNKFYLNNEPIFLRFVLDQGFYPDGIWTAPSDAELKADVERSQAVGFNGARLHQKVFEERFHYWADRLGYLTWGEFCDWGMNFGRIEAIHNQQREWREIVLRDLNHPSIVAWTPFNETAGAARNHTEAHRQGLQETYDLTRALDPTRPVHDVSGYVHVCTDIFTVHDYDQDPEAFRERYASVDPQHPEDASIRLPELSIPYEGQPYVVDEYGGTWWMQASDSDATDREQSWGYGKRPEDIEDVYQRIEKLTHALTSHPHIAGYTYTQLTDIEQEQNGIYTYERESKFDAERLRKAFGAPAAIEKTEEN